MNITNRKIKEIFRMPDVFESSALNFWDQPYIAKQLLAAHLNPNFEGASRNKAFIDASLQWLTEILPLEEYKSIIDLGCGPGLYSEGLAQAKYKVTGIDFSKSSIEYAQKSSREKELTINYRYDNYLTWSEPVTYDAALLIYCDYGALSFNNRKVVLQNIYDSLKIGGCFLLDVFSTTKYEQFNEQQTWSLEDGGGFWEESVHTLLQRNCIYPNKITLEQTFVWSNKEIKTYNIWYQFFSKQQLIKELEAAGFKIKAIFSDLRGTAFNEQSETIAVLAQKL